jgi:hypothetical protein
MFARQHQLQLEAGELDEGTFRLRWLDRVAPIEVGDEVLVEIRLAAA